MINPLDDTSRWTIMASRFETPQILREAMDEMFEEFVAGLPEDSPARLLWEHLPKPPKPGEDPQPGEAEKAIAEIGRITEMLTKAGDL